MTPRKIPGRYILPDDEVVLKERAQTMKIILPPAPPYKPSTPPSLLSYTGPRNHTPPANNTFGVKAYIVGGGYQEKRLFDNRVGFTTCTWKADADMFVFTGGEDINPALYGETPHSSVHFTHSRDVFEVDFYKSLPRNVFKFGICRGAQLLNVMNGGKLYQHVDNHHGNHKMKDLKNNQILITNSLHHQMMIPGPGAVLLATADQSSFRINGDGEYFLATGDYEADSDPEVIWYPATNSLCVQGHPEYESANADFKNYVFDLIETYYWELYGDNALQQTTEKSSFKPSLS